MKRASFADLYRPRAFGEVYGQASVVDCLSSLIQRGQIGRDILLHGSVGSGKTSLAWIYARALNCEAPQADGSPCLTCDTCRGCDRPGPDGNPCGRCGPCRQKDGQAIAGLHSYNVGRKGGSRALVTAWTEPLVRTTPRHRYKILFYDEAHALRPDACDGLLELVEQSENRVLFFFATTEVDKIRPALRSRLFDLLVRPLSPDDAYRFLEVQARKARPPEPPLDYEPEALALLAGLRRGLPRDLLLGLDRVHEPGTRLTVARVRAAFDADQTEPLLTYFGALAEGDLAAQTALMAGWQESVNDKIAWIQAFLLSLYANDIRHRRLRVDGLIDAIPEGDRAPILVRFCQRLNLRKPADLAETWHRMMDFWSWPAQRLAKPDRAGDIALSLRVALFHRLVNDDLRAECGRNVEDRSDSIAPVHTLNQHGPTVTLPSRGFGEAPPSPVDCTAGVASEDPQYLTAADARAIVNRASFLMQEYGALFNTAFVVRPGLLGTTSEADSIALIDAFGEALADQVRAWGGPLSARLTLFVREGREVYGRLVAHLPRPGPGQAGGDCLARAPDWRRAWIARHGSSGEDAVVQETAGTDDAAALAFHWDNTLGLCAGLDPEILDWDPRVGACKSLVSLLGIQRQQGLGPIVGHPLVHAPGPLSDTAIARACVNRLEPLSAFDDRVWGELRSGWELREFEDRRATRRERERQLSTLSARHGPDSDEASDLVRRWSDDPKRRPRRWATWW
ncbi:AAA family ATPase [Methylobacterium sp. WL8]|uniref:AAA family ATPase n=1 Tax=Methylobacterium sp. WL8 TaxID=2603899 RepID=UPI0011C8057B|nr:AAA family ATPase [Methylobacterium sp. WL8]TXN81266.1 AAA family ATPase [Methylobacterium sp. WL8]